MCDILPHVSLYDNHTSKKLKVHEENGAIRDEEDVFLKSKAINAVVNQLGDVSLHVSGQLLSTKKKGQP